MPSPFPGMNPYLERDTEWESFRVCFVSNALGHIAAQVLPRYIVQIESRLYVHELTDEARARGDNVDREKIRHLVVRELDGRNLVTVIELLSPTNKRAGPHRAQYLTSRGERLHSHAHFVELDLLRAGPRMPLAELPAGDYCALVSRAEGRPRVEVWSWNLRDPMPLIPIPLNEGDADATLDIKAVVDQVYDGGRYAKYIYTGPPEPRLAPDDAAWAAPFLPSAS